MQSPSPVPSNLPSLPTTPKAKPDAKQGQNQIQSASKSGPKVRPERFNAPPPPNKPLPALPGQAKAPAQAAKEPISDNVSDDNSNNSDNDSDIVAGLTPQGPPSAANNGIGANSAHQAGGAGPTGKPESKTDDNKDYSRYFGWDYVGDDGMWDDLDTASQRAEAGSEPAQTQEAHHAQPAYSPANPSNENDSPAHTGRLTTEALKQFNEMNEENAKKRDN